ncbi:MAG: hypothetical protein NZ701_16330 [Roseiflexus sp.]|nr:hypothetical protein [Roseiflexus sp.]
MPLTLTTNSLRMPLLTVQGLDLTRSSPARKRPLPISKSRSAGDSRWSSVPAAAQSAAGQPSSNNTLALSPATGTSSQYFEEYGVVIDKENIAPD